MLAKLGVFFFLKKTVLKENKSETEQNSMWKWVLFERFAWFSMDDKGQRKAIRAWAEPRCLPSATAGLPRADVLTDPEVANK